jgi:hypothetical protein
MPVQDESRQRLLDARSSGHDGGVLGASCVPSTGTESPLARHLPHPSSPRKRGPSNRCRCRTSPDSGYWMPAPAGMTVVCWERRASLPRGQTNTYPRPLHRPHTHPHSRSRGAPSGGVLMVEREQRRSGTGPLPVALTRVTATRRRKPVPNIRRCGSGIAGPHGILPGDPGKSRSEAGRLGAAKRRRLPASPVWMRVKNRRGGRSGERPKLRTTRPALARAPATPSPHPEVLGEAEPRRTGSKEPNHQTSELPLARRRSHAARYAKPEAPQTVIPASAGTQ